MCPIEYPSIPVPVKPTMTFSRAFTEAMFVWVLVLMAVCISLPACSVLGVNTTATAPAAVTDLSFAGLTAKASAGDSLAAAVLKTNVWVCNDVRQGRPVDLMLVGMIPDPSIQMAAQLGTPVLNSALEHFCTTSGYYPAPTPTPVPAK